MARGFIACDREQSFLMPPDVREWLSEDHFAWFVLDAVAAVDLEAFMASIASMGAPGRPMNRRSWWRWFCTRMRVG
jgi:hypothetical protein